MALAWNAGWGKPLRGSNPLSSAKCSDGPAALTPAPLRRYLLFMSWLRRKNADSMDPQYLLGQAEAAAAYREAAQDVASKMRDLPPVEAALELFSRSAGSAAR